jgi:hypothetical protein
LNVRTGDGNLADPSENVAKTLKILRIDYQRQGDRLELRQIERLLDKRQLNPFEGQKVYELLASEGIVPEDEETKGKCCGNRCSIRVRS